MDFDALKEKLASTPALRPVGRVLGVTGLTVRLALPSARMGDIVIIRRRGDPMFAEIVGFHGGEAVAVPLGELVGIGPDDAVESTGSGLTVRVGPDLLGRVLDGLGRPIDGFSGTVGARSVAVDRSPPKALERPPISEPLATGIRAVDGLLTLGVGQRVGLFAGSGVGKSTLLGSIARGCRADVVVVALVGERGREVTEFLERSLKDEGRQKSVVVVATSDAPALERLRAAQVATAIAESFRDDGKNVMLLVDSVTRVARAQREVGLAAGEPPARRGYPPSVFALLPRLLERTGCAQHGSITAIYTVLVEAADMDEPIADEVRGILDGHIVLSRELAGRGHFPAIDIVQSISRVMDCVAERRHARDARAVKKLIHTYEEKRDLIVLGAYHKGSDALVDAAIESRERVEAFLQQEPGSSAPMSETIEKLAAIPKPAS